MSADGAGSLPCSREKIYKVSACFFENKIIKIVPKAATNLCSGFPRSHR
jgi:hypothetical protein